MSAILPAGSRLAVVAPSHDYNPERLEAGMRWARDQGWAPVLLGSREPYRRFAAEPARRLERLVRALSSPEFDACWIVRGGSGLLQLLDPLCSAELVPRPIIGFSDVTALFCALHRRADWTLVHGPVLHSVPVTDASSLQALAHMLRDDPALSLEGTWATRAEPVHAPVVGGNLSLLAATCGTAHQLNARGHILVLEEIGEQPYRIERLLQQLMSSGVFDGVAAVALGEFLDCRPPHGAAWSLEDALRDVLAPLDVPVVGGLPIGHGTTNMPFIWGQDARLAGTSLELRGTSPALS